MFKYTERKFAKEVGRIAETINPSLQYAYLADSREVKLTPSDNSTSEEHIVFLGNIFLKAAKMPTTERLRWIDAYLRETLTPKKRTEDEFMEALTLRVRTDYEIDFRNRNTEQMGYEAAQTVSHRKGDLVLEVVSDNDQSITLLQKDHLVEFGITEIGATRMAAAKMRRNTNENQWERIDESIWMSTYQDDYDFARLLATEDYPKFPFNAPPIVFAPSHSICLATDRPQASILSKMIDSGYDLSASHRPLSQLLWTVKDNGDWKVWQLGSISEVFEIASRQVAAETSNNYEQTKAYFERHLTEDIFVANYKAIENDDGITCYCVYTLDLPSYLPLTDFVVIVDQELPKEQSVVGRVDWYKFENCCKDIEQIEGMYPVWYRMLRPLDTDQKNQLRQLAQPIN